MLSAGRDILIGGLILLVRLYQWGLSPLVGHNCRYQPRCSDYAVTALLRFGPLKGSLLTLWRLLRCNPWAGYGADPVPERRSPATKHA